jgi:sulfite reductase (NADPH) flavoprotein alpha-component
MTSQPPGSVLSANQLEQVNGLARTLDREQAIWISGFFAGIASRAVIGEQDGAALTAPAPVAQSTRTLTILYGTETGNSRELATTLTETAMAQGLEPRLVDMADYKVRSLKDERDLVVITSTHGEGDPPQTTLDFFEFLQGRKAPKLPELRYAVLALGDSTYEQYCAAGRFIDERLAELGAQRLVDRLECDVDYDEPAAAWLPTVLAALAPTEQPRPAAAAAAAAGGAVVAPTQFGKRNPFHAPVLENVVLTGRGSSKETRHVELSLEDSGLTYEPGDALGVVARNDPALADLLLDRLGLADAALREALIDRYEITALTPRFIEHWAQLSGAEELQALLGPDQAVARTAYLQGHHVLDVVTRFPVPGIEPDQFLAGLRPLQPRLYSIASSLSAAPDEAHLTVSTVRYDLHDVTRTGVASGYLAGRTDDDHTVPVYIQANTHFRLPDDDTPVLMVGAGTGVAPYRAFMQEREARGCTGKSWLFFGERNFRSDFLYQVEWQQLVKRGVLSRLDLAFSRDAAPKTYVQDRLRLRGRDVYGWLEDGASLYVCGDAAQMAPDVHATLAEIVAEHGGMDREGADAYLAGLKRDRRYLLDVY